MVEASYFNRDELPDQMWLGHQQQGLDALHGVCGAVWTHASEREFPLGLTHQELYKLRVTTRMAPADYYQQCVGEVLLGGILQELAGKVDVY